jgi:hypothetical protein
MRKIVWTLGLLMVVCLWLALSVWAANRDADKVKEEQLVLRE